MFPKRYTNTPTLLAFDAMNAAWACRILYVESISSQQGLRADPIFYVLLVSAIAIHLRIWYSISGRTLLKTYDSAAALQRDLRDLGNDLFGSAPYFIKLIPPDETLRQRSRQLMADTGSVATRTGRDLILLLLRTPGLQLAHFAAVFFAGFLVLSGSLPSFAQWLQDLWPIRAVVMSVLCGVIVQSASVIIFVILKD